MGYVCDVMTATNTYFSTGLIGYNLWPFDSSCHSSLIIPNRLYTRLKKKWKTIMLDICIHMVWVMC